MVRNGNKSGRDEQDRRWLAQTVDHPEPDWSGMIHEPVMEYHYPNSYCEQEVNVVRKTASCTFKVLETVSYRFDLANSVLQEIIANPARRVSEMWTGCLTGTDRDYQYKIILCVMESILTGIVDSLVGAVKKEAAQLAVFIRRTWMTVYPVCGKFVEDAIIEFDIENRHWLGNDSDDSAVPLWDSEDEERERILDELDADLAALQAEISAWETLLRDGDFKATEFALGRSGFKQRLSAVNNITGTLIAGGSSSVEDLTRQLGEWEHPEIRREKKVQQILQSEIQEATWKFTKNAHDCMGAPTAGFCFEPGVPIDARWNSIRFPAWSVETSCVVPVGSPTQPRSPISPKNNNHRLSVDALRGFH